ncbi:hypothetical protein HYS94_02375 [Candidatus Daviesbacteria bacterium]|nr:hypothetical protein [Candidatus Daviesbacteria bacterium]
MIEAIVLFVLIVVISFFLALRSMRDYQEVGNPAEYALFLIRKSAGLTEELLDNLFDDLFQKSQVLSLERLFKGQNSALTVFGPKDILLKYAQPLDLLELEDYTNLPEDRLTVWEVTLKNSAPEDFSFASFPKLLPDEQFFWQLVFKGKKNKGEKVFLGQIRLAVVVPDSRRKQLISQLQNVNHLLKIPRPFSQIKMWQFYQQRSLENQKDNLILTAQQVIKLIML